MNLMLVFQQGDPVLMGVFLILIAMSVITWYFIIVRLVQIWRIRRANQCLECAIWDLNDRTHLYGLLERYPNMPFTQLIQTGWRALAHYQTQKGKALEQTCKLDDFLTRAIRKALAQENGKQEAGMSILASVGATAPFIGLFGTVWGIYHALVNIGIAGQVTIGAVAGPIGEALVATAAGLAAAIPAVLAYNALNRLQRMFSQTLDGFAHDVYAQLLDGSLTAPLGGKS